MAWIRSADPPARLDAGTEYPIPTRAGIPTLRKRYVAANEKCMQ